MRAEVTVAVERRGERSVYTRLRSAPPVSLRPTPDALYLVGSGAGPIGGDDLSVRIHVGSGARLTVRSVAASIVLPGTGEAPSRAWFDIVLEASSTLRLLLAPQILAAGCDHEVTTRIEVGDGASLLWRDETVLGRHEEASGSLFHRVRVTVADRPVLASDLAIGPRWPGSLGPGGLDGAGAVGSLLCTDPWSPEPPAGVGAARGAVLTLGDDATLATVVAPGASEVARWLDRLGGPPEHRGLAFARPRSMPLLAGVGE